MREYLRSAPKTIPSNYSVVPEDHQAPNSEAVGYSCTAEAWAKAERQESTFWDWDSYEACQMPKMEHPEYVQRASIDKLFKDWDQILRYAEKNNGRLPDPEYLPD